MTTRWRYRISTSLKTSFKLTVDYLANCISDLFHLRLFIWLRLISIFIIFSSSLNCNFTEMPLGGTLEQTWISKIDPLPLSIEMIESPLPFLRSRSTSNIELRLRIADCRFSITKIMAKVIPGHPSSSSWLPGPPYRIFEPSFSGPRSGLLTKNRDQKKWTEVLIRTCPGIHDHKGSSTYKGPRHQLHSDLTFCSFYILLNEWVKKKSHFFLDNLEKFS